MTPKDKNLAIAQDIIWTAFETNSKAKRIRLSQQALEICSDCADAYVILADDLLKENKERIAFLQEGVKAGRRALGPRYFKDDVGHFWGILETRPYMRALSALALYLDKDGQTNAAIEHYLELIRLNPNDNQGIRYLLIPLLVSINSFKQATELLKLYKEDIGVWVQYSRVLLHFKQRGNTKVARKSLDEAISCNPHVIEYLLAPKFKSNLLESDYYSSGGKDEAYLYANDWRQDWHQTKGALEWLIACLIEGYLSNSGPNRFGSQQQKLSAVPEPE